MSETWFETRANSDLSRIIESVSFFANLKAASKSTIVRRRLLKINWRTRTIAQYGVELSWHPASSPKNCSFYEIKMWVSPSTAWDGKVVLGESEVETFLTVPLAVLVLEKFRAK